MESGGPTPWNHRSVEAFSQTATGSRRRAVAERRRPWRGRAYSYCRAMSRFNRTARRAGSQAATRMMTSATT